MVFIALLLSVVSVSGVRLCSSERFFNSVFAAYGSIAALLFTCIINIFYVLIHDKSTTCLDATQVERIILVDKDCREYVQ
jgi:hypothetical protein